MDEVNSGSSSSGKWLLAVAALALVTGVVAVRYLSSQRRYRHDEWPRDAPTARPGCAW
jgi:hypothetical protein